MKELSQAKVAGAAKQSPDYSGGRVVVDIEPGIVAVAFNFFGRLSANAAAAILLVKQFLVIGSSHAVKRLDVSRPDSQGLFTTEFGALPYGSNYLLRAFLAVALLTVFAVSVVMELIQGLLAATTRARLMGDLGVVTARICVEITEQARLIRRMLPSHEVALSLEGLLLVRLMRAVARLHEPHNSTEGFQPLLARRSSCRHSPRLRRATSRRVFL